MVTQAAGKNGHQAKTVASAETLRDAIMKRFTGVLFEVPGYELSVEVTALKRWEREAIIAAVEGPDGRWDNLLQNRLAVAYALLSPPIVDLPRETAQQNEKYIKAASEALREWPDSLIDPIAAEIWRISNTYTKEVEEKIGEVLPFRRMSGLPSSSSTELESTPSTSSGGRSRSGTASTSGT